MSNQPENELWQKRKILFFVFLGYTVYWFLILTLPYFNKAGSEAKTSFFKLGFVLPIFGIVFALSSLSKFSPIYKTSKNDLPFVVLFAILVFLLPLFAHLHEIQQIEIAKSIWILAQVSSICLGLFTGVLFFKRLRKTHHSLGLAIIIGLFATSLGGLLGAILFKFLSLISN
jgi:hypothetical protein